MENDNIPKEIEQMVNSLSKSSYVKVSINLSETAISGIDKVAELFNKSRTEVIESLILTTLPIYLDMNETSISKAKNTEYYKKNKKVLDEILNRIPKIRAKLFG